VLQAAAGKRDHVSVFGTDYDTPDGTAVRDYIHIEDLGAAHILGLERATEPGEHRIYNLGNGTGFSVRQVIEAARAGHRPRDPGQEEAAARAIRPRWWPPRSGSATSSAGSPASPRSRR
jgi:UDP-glucose 4-epimerase